MISLYWNTVVMPELCTSTIKNIFSKRKVSHALTDPIINESTFQSGPRVAQIGPLVWEGLHIAWSPCMYVCAFMCSYRKYLVHLNKYCWEDQRYLCSHAKQTHVVIILFSLDKNSNFGQLHNKWQEPSKQIKAHFQNIPKSIKRIQIEITQFYLKFILSESKKKHKFSVARNEKEIEFKYHIYHHASKYIFD
jgi:hypothetical protein